MATKLKVLVLCDFQGKDANVVRDFLYCFNHFSRHEFYYLHSWRGNQCRRLRKIDFNDFDAIVFFWDCYWLDVDNILSQFYLPEWVVDRIARSSALKIQFLQDEYREVRKINRIMARFGIDLMFTCVAESDHEYFYPLDLIPTLKATYTILTGYVPAYLERIAVRPPKDRPVDIGYRSRIPPYFLGSLAQEKEQIAVEFTRIGQQHGFSVDISVREEDRIYGQDWLEFLNTSRFSLGTESGASVVDLDGQIRAQSQRFLKDHPNASFDEVKKRFFADVDGKLTIQTISPRVFEAAAFENTLVLHEGEYAGIIQPDIHFIRVKKDYSNVDEVVAKMRDQTYCARLARTAREDLIRSGKYSYKNFVKRFDDALSRHRVVTRLGQAQTRLKFYVTSYLNGDRIVPRAGTFSMLPHPSRLASAFRVSALSMIASVNLILALLGSCSSLRARLIEALRTGNAGCTVSWGGLARDLRILALLNLARHKKGIHGPEFDVHVSYDVSQQRLVFCSVPSASNCSNIRAGGAPDWGREQELLCYLKNESQVRWISWDHSQVGDSFILPGFGNRFFLIFLDVGATYSFRNWHALYESRKEEELAILSEIVLRPMQQVSWKKKFAVLLLVTWSFLVERIFRKPEAKIRKITQWLFSAPAPERSEPTSAGYRRG